MILALASALIAILVAGFGVFLGQIAADDLYDCLTGEKEAAFPERLLLAISCIPALFSVWLALGYDEAETLAEAHLEVVLYGKAGK